ncbi:hypothetical protein A2U01_0083239, partial [Trifolium medium]|nr:hypothetical protein [Trifolium medium]
GSAIGAGRGSLGARRRSCSVVEVLHLPSAQGAA